MTALRILVILAWTGVLIYMAAGAWAAAFGKARYGDPMRLACFITALLFIGYSLRWLIAPDHDASWMMLHVLSVADACFIAWLGRTYGRGPIL